MSFTPNKPRKYASPKDVVGQLFKQAGGVPRVMELLELSRTRTYALTDPQDRAEISFSRVASLTQSTRATAAAEYLAQLAGGAFLPLDADTHDDWHDLTAALADQHAQVLAKLLRSLGPRSESPGNIDAAEARELLAHLDELMTLVAAKRRLLMAVIADQES